MGLSDLVNKLASKTDYLAWVAFWENKARNGDIYITQLQEELNLLKEKLSKTEDNARHRLVMDYWNSWQKAVQELAVLKQESEKTRTYFEAVFADYRDRNTKLQKELAAVTNQNQVKIREFDKLVVKLAEKQSSKPPVCYPSYLPNFQAAEDKVNNLIKETASLKEYQAVIKMANEILIKDTNALDMEVTGLEKDNANLTLINRQIREELFRVKKERDAVRRQFAWALYGGDESGKTYDVIGCPCEKVCNCGSAACSLGLDKKNNKEQCTKNQSPGSIQESTCPTTTASLILRLQISLKGPLLTPETISYLQVLGWVVDTQCVNKAVTDYKLTYVVAYPMNLSSESWVAQTFLLRTMRSLKLAGY